MHEFTPWPKTARLFRDVVVTEKLDGTNSAVHISRLTGGWEDYPPESYSLVVDGVRYIVTAQSRKRLIWPGKATDNYGFAAWVYDNARDLVRLLGEGRHYGEWWGAGIQRGYDQPGKRFSLFNTERHGDTSEIIGGSMVQSVPKLYEGTFSEPSILAELNNLREYGSVAAPGFPTPEGLCVFHTALGRVAKVTLDANDAGKWEGA